MNRCFSRVFLVLAWQLGVLTVMHMGLLVCSEEPAFGGVVVVGGAVQVAGASSPALRHHWTFDRLDADAFPDEVARQSDAGTASPIELTRGVFGAAADLKEGYIVKTRGPGATELQAITLSAWVRPVDLSGFREIIRRECKSRLLFSFQENGTVLSLGLDIGGYVECDAPCDPGALTNGRWHHCAATFDGNFMRVYIDGVEVGSLDRPGRISADPGVPAFIGSSSGAGEFFQGGLDDLRVYDVSLTAEEIASIHRAGLDSLAQLAIEVERRLGPLYPVGRSFAVTLAEFRRVLWEGGLSQDGDLVEGGLARLESGFPDLFRSFFGIIGVPAARLFSSEEPDELAAAGERCLKLLIEYRPITAEQWARQTSDELVRWEKVKVLEESFQKLKGAGADARFSPGWIEFILAAGAEVQLRPARHEAVAPYVEPATPPTRTLTAAEERECLERDWLMQCGGEPSVARIKDEIRWARGVAQRISSGASGSVELEGELARLDELERKLALVTGPDRELYLDVRAVKRAILLKNPLIDFDELLLVDMPYPQGSEWRHETRHRLGYMAVPGGRLLVLKGLSPGGEVRSLMPKAPLHGSFWRPEVTHDGRSVLFCFKPHNEKSFHLYRIDFNGENLEQITDGPYDDLDPIELADGRIMFSTTRGHTYVRCMPPTNAFVLARCEADGRNIYILSANNEPDYLPSLLSDGRVVYTRWEYTDKPLWRAQKLWTVNPDGTMVQTLWGNQSVWPDLMKDARQIPGSHRVMFTGSAHHDWFAGSVGIIDPDAGFNFPLGISKVTADVPWPECGNGPVDPAESPLYHGSGCEAFYSPYPLGEHDFLVSASRGGKFLLYLMDTEGNRELIYEGVHNILHAMPVKPRPLPTLRPDRVDWPGPEEREAPKAGVLFSGDVYQGAPPELRDKARYLRIFHIEPKTYTYWWQRPYISTGPVVSAVQSEGVKVLLGTVPIEKDGSVAFEAPAGKALHFQLLDEDQRALQTMRSFVGLMPGERRGCLGCHETHSRTPAVSSAAIAIQKDIPSITPPPWPDTSVSYTRYVQPVLDQYCGKCHQGDGQAKEVLDLTFRPGPEVHSEPYLTLIGRPTWGQPYAIPANAPPGFGIADTLLVEGFGQVDPTGYLTPKPMTRLSYASRLISLCSSGSHYGVKVDRESLLRLIVWVDAMCPYQGSEEIRAIEDPVFQGVDWLAIRPRIKSAPRPVRPGPFGDRE